MKRFLCALFALALAAIPAPADACTVFWTTGGNGNWSSTTNWSATSGGASGHAIPTTTDDVCFDSASSVASTMDQAFTIVSLDFAGTQTGASGSPFTGTWTQNAFTLTISGNDGGAATTTLRLSSGMTYAPSANTRLVTLTATSGTSSITTACSVSGGLCTNHLWGSITISGSGGTFQFADTYGIRADGTLTHTNGTLSFNNQNGSTGLIDESSVNVRTWNLGTGTITLTSVGGAATNPLNVANSANLTLNASTSTLALNATATAGRNLQLGAKTWNNITISNPAFNALRISVGSSGTINNLTATNVGSIQVNTGVTLTVNGTISYSGRSAAQPSALTSEQSGVGTISVGGAQTLSNVFIQNLTKSGAGSITANSSYDGGGNTSITINAPASGGAGIIGG